MTLARLRLLNRWRWLREFALLWSFLALIYSIILTLVLQPILEQIFKKELAFQPLWAATVALLWAPALLNRIPLAAVSFRRGILTFMPQGIFAERFWDASGWRLSRLYLQHELRRGGSWLAVLLGVIATTELPESKRPLWVLLAQLPIQRALYGLHHWRSIAVIHHPGQAGPALLVGVTVSQLIQLLVGWAALGLTLGLSPETWLAYGAGGLGAILASSAVCLEGDAGRPWIVNFIALAAGTLAGYVCLAYPIALIAVVYLWDRMRAAVSQRLLSLEHLDEDTLIP